MTEIITAPGKFEGEPTYVPYFYDAWLNGDGEHGETDDGLPWVRLYVEPADREQFPELTNVEWIELYEDTQGFVHSEIQERA